MKRKAILIGNTSGLPGVNVDIKNFAGFLKSNKGGAWYDEEIEIIRNERKDVLLRKIDTLRKQSLDYVMVLFSGHGGQLRETMLEINGEGETIAETSLRAISDRQLNVYDCCRSLLEETASLKMESFDSVTRSFASPIRRKYEDRIMKAIPQQALLYSCSIGQVSYDTPNGGVYLSSLLTASQHVNQSSEFKLVGTAHEEAVILTTQHNLKEKQKVQSPEAILPKCMSSQQLIISLNS